MAEGDAASTVTVRHFAAARAAAGVREEKITLSPGKTVGDLIEVLGRDRPALATVLARCSFLLDEVAVRHPSQVVPPGCTVDVLPPFAGG
ncbi:MAG: MoaD/ThiS family protein [Mycobacteriaceae bacterium]